MNLGPQHDIRGVNVADNHQSLALYAERDRSYVAAEPLAQCRPSVAYRYHERVIPVTWERSFTLRGPLGLPVTR